jgi:anti-sigma factor RsiW
MTLMLWTCELTEERLSDYIDDLLTPEERTAFLKHVPSCARCAPMFAGVSHLVKNLHSIAEVDAPPRLVYSILDQTLGPRESFWQKTIRMIRGIGAQRFAYGAASLAATFLLVVSASGFNFRHPKMADLNPVSIYHQADRGAHRAYARGAKFFSDLRVVNEIQSRLRENEQAPVNQEESLPPRNPGKDPGSTDGTKPGPRQQNRADGIYRSMEVLAEEMPVFNGLLGARFEGRSTP